MEAGSIWGTFKKEVLLHRGRRDKILLALALVGLVASAAYYFLSKEMPDEPGSLQALMCYDCRAKSTERVVSLEESPLRCKSCGGALGYRYKCADCHRDFPAVPYKPKTFELQKELEKAYKDGIPGGGPICPNCHSTNTNQVSIDAP